MILYYKNQNAVDAIRGQVFKKTKLQLGNDMAKNQLKMYLTTNLVVNAVKMPVKMAIVREAKNSVRIPPRKTKS